MAPLNVPRLLCQYMRTALIRRLNLSETQVTVAVAAAYDPLREGDVFIQVIPGKTATEGGGSGAQAGGALLRRQWFEFVLWHRLNLDEHDRTDYQLTEVANGILDYFEQIRNVFLYTFFGDATSANIESFNGLLFEPMRYEGESASILYDVDSGVAKRSISFSGAYGIELPTATTLNTPDFT
jgi:hypothetical protein